MKCVESDVNLQNSCKTCYHVIVHLHKLFGVTKVYKHKCGC